MKRIFIIAPIFSAIVLIGMPWVIEAQEEVVQMPQPESQAEVTVSEEQAALAQIAQQLEEVEREVNRLSLLVSTLVLEKQALALQERLSQIVATSEETPMKSGSAVAAREETKEEPPQAEKKESAEAFAQEQEKPADILSAITLKEEPSSGTLVASQRRDEAESNRGFFAALGPLGNLGTPELAALAILVILAVFILVRRLRERRKSSSRSVPIQPSQGSQVPQDLLQEGRQKLKEGVAWK